MNKLIEKIKRWFRVWMEWECPDCGGELLETYSGALGGKRCKDCDYRFTRLL